MSVKLGSKYALNAGTDYVVVQMDNKAKFVTEEPAWIERTVTRDHSKVVITDVPKRSLEIVTTGTLTVPFKVGSYASTIGCAFKVGSQLNLGDGRYARAQLWDTAGQERFRTIGRSYYRGANVALIVYDITCSQSGSEENLLRWIEEVKSSNNDCIVVLIGNKCDDQDRRNVSPDSVKSLAEQQGIFWTECSAKTGENLAFLFARIYSEAYMSFWKRGIPFELIKVVIMGDSGVGKTTLFDRMEGFAVDLSPLVREFPIKSGVEGTDVSEKSISREKQSDQNVDNLRTKLVPRPDTNLISLNLGLLGMWTDKCILATGDAEGCSCGAYLSMHSKISDDGKFWHCNFCSKVNEIHLEPEELPQHSAIDYLQKGTPSLDQGKFIEDNSFVVFCIDTSGSMVVTSSISEKDALKLRKKDKIKNSKSQVTTEANDSVSQYLPNEKRGMAYISRLEAVQYAIESQIATLQKEHPNRVTVLVTFASDVTIFGDGMIHPIVLAGDKLNSIEELENISQWWRTTKSNGGKGDDSTIEMELTEQQKAKLLTAKTKQELVQILNSGEKPAITVPLEDLSLAPILKSRMSLSEKIFSLAEEGQTALGPALLVSCVLAQQKPGSKVILCTDGLANIGVGSMEIREKDEEQIKQFYHNIAKKALQSNTTISLMGFKGADSNFEVLGEMALKTGGQVDKVDPAQVNNNLISIFADDAISTDVSVTLRMSKGVTISEKSLIMDDWKTISPDVYTKHFGTINSDTNLLIQYILDSTIFGNNNLTNISFQFQIKYTRIEDGKTLLRIISLNVPVSNSKDEAYKHADIEAIGLNAVRSVAHTAQLGYYTTARLENYAQLQLMKSVAQALSNQPTGTISTTAKQTRTSKSSAEEIQDVLKSFSDHSTKFEAALFKEQHKEVLKGTKWDETEEKMKELTLKYPNLVPNNQNNNGNNWISSALTSFVSWVLPSSSASNSTSTNTSATTTVAATTTPTVFNPQARGGQREDEVSNLLWNMRGANML